MARDGHEVAVAANHGAAFQMNWDSGSGVVPIFPEGLRQYSVDIFIEQLARWGGISVGLFDTWCLVPMAEQLKRLKLGWWVPIDHDPLPPLVGEFVAKSDALAIAMSRFGEQKLLQHGIAKDKVTYIPHAFDSKKVFLDRGVESRAAMQVPEDSHVVMMNAANRGKQPVRKAFGPNLEALVRHLNNHSDAYAYIHTEPYGLSDGMNIERFLNILQAPMDRIRFPEPLQFRNGYPAEMLSHMYSSSNVLLATSMGEGFGCPTVEAQLCGTPVIASDFAASAELVGPHGYKIGGQREWDEFQLSWWTIPNIDQIEKALDENYRMTKAKQIDRSKVRKFAEQYDADLIYERHWKPTIARLDSLKR
jgi:glycosyltransferase involved in cell wall biosynthesis